LAGIKVPIVFLSFFGSYFFGMTSFIWLMLLWHGIFYFSSFCIAHTLFLKNIGERFMTWSFLFWRVYVIFDLRSMKLLSTWILEFDKTQHNVSGYVFGFSRSNVYGFGRNYFFII
jgi:hypothetical protein